MCFDARVPLLGSAQAESLFFQGEHKAKLFLNTKVEHSL